MKNLKRLLSLALTGVMLSGMMVMGASAADFTDADKIVNTEAVDTMVALNIINGKDTGDFDPEGLVTRAEMAKMIATAVNGGVAPTFGVKTVPTYSDTKGHWAEQFIEYCSDMKYINGRGNGTFDPNGNVTGTEAAKMVLTALGYETRAYQLTGADWAINTNALAIRDCKPSLYENLNGVSMNMPITRDSAAQLIWNGVQNYIVEYNPNVTITGTDITYGYEKSTTTTLLKLAYDANISSGTFDGNSKVIPSLKDDQLQVTVDTVNGVELETPDSKKITADLDIGYIGENVKVIWKDEKNTTRGLDAKDKIYGVFPTGETEVVHATLGDVKDFHKAEAKIVVGDETYDVDTTDGVSVTWNLARDNAGTKVYDGTTGKDYDNGSASSNSDLTAALKKPTGDDMKIIFKDGKVRYIYVTETKLGVVTAKTSEKVTIGGLGTLTIADHDIYEDIAKGDVVNYTRLYDADELDKAFVTVTEAEVISGTVDGYKKTETIKVDGTDYKIYNGAYAAVSGMSPANETTIDGTDIGVDVDLYMVNDYVAAVVHTSEAADNYSVITDVKPSGTTNNVFTNLQVQVMDMEGNKTILTVSDKSEDVANSDDVIDVNDYKIGDVVTYTLNDKNEAILAMVSQYTGATTQTYDKDEKTLNDVVTAGDCVLFVETTGKTLGTTSVLAGSFKAFKIRDLGSQDFTGTVAKDKDGKVIFAVAAMSGTPDGATIDTVFGLVVADNGTTKIKGTAYNTYKVWTADGEIDVNIKDAASNDTLNKGTIYGFVRTSDDTYANNTKFVEVSQNATVAGALTAITVPGDKDYRVMDILVKEYNEGDGIITFHTGKGVADGDGAYTHPTGTKTYAVDKDAKIVYVNLDKDIAGEEVGVNGYDVSTGKSNALIITADDSTKVLYIFVETTGKVDAFKK